MPDDTSAPRSPHLYVYAPSSAVRDKAALRRGVRRLQAQGYQVELDRDALAADTRFAGDDATRIAAIERAAASGADLALITRGGYGLSRILPGIAYDQVARAIERGTQFVGLSDFTALQMALLAHSGAPTWAGPSVEVDWGTREEPDEIMAACFDDLAQGVGEGTGWTLPKAEALAAPLAIEGATLWGGNLAMLCSLLGTPYFPQVQGGILFLEDVGEHPYRIERMLTQLLHAGVLARQQAVLLGQFTGFQLAPHDKGYKLASVVAWLRAQIQAPVLTHLPFGHVATKVLLPVGAPVTLAAEGRQAMLLWQHPD